MTQGRRCLLFYSCLLYEFSVSKTSGSNLKELMAVEIALPETARKIEENIEAMDFRH